MLYFQVVYCHVNKTSQQYLALYITYSHVSDGKIKAVAANWCLVVRTREDTPAALIVYPTLGRCHQHVAQCCENIRSSFRYTKKFVWVTSACIEMLITNICKHIQILKKNKNMIRGIHYFSTEIKKKIDVIPRSCYK